MGSDIGAPGTRERQSSKQVFERYKFFIGPYDKAKAYSQKDFYQVDIYPPHMLGQALADEVLTEAFHIIRAMFEGDPTAYVGLTRVMNFSGKAVCGIEDAA